MFFSRFLERVRTPVLWRTVPWLFFSVVLIQLCGLFPLVQSQRRTLYTARANQLKARIETALRVKSADPGQVLQSALGDRHKDVLGAALYAPSGAMVTAVGQAPPKAVATSQEPELVKRSPRIWEVRWLHTMNGVTYSVNAAIDVSREAEQVNDFIVLAALLTIPSALVATVSGGAILLFGVIFPLRRLRDELLGRVERETSNAAADTEDGYDELAQVRTLVNRLDEARAEAREAERRADLANRAKDEFLANMSHELRSPLASIVSHADILLEMYPEAEGFGKDLKKIKGSARHVSELVGQILTLSKLEAGRMVADAGTFEVRAAVEATVDMVDDQIEKNGNRLLLDVAADVTTMHSDELKVRQILLNLLTNAAKFTSQGTIRVTVREIAASAPGWLVFAISDSGIGMTEEQLKKVFEPFVQADGSTTRLYGGTGLGLSISDRLCRILGGRIEATSVPDQGSTFTVWLPAKVPAELP